MAISAETKAIVQYLYKVYGSYSGYLFGIPPELQGAVEAVVESAISLYKECFKH